MRKLQHCTLDQKYIIKLWTAYFNSLPNNKILVWFMLKAHADDNIDISYNLRCGEGRKCWLPAFHLFHNVYEWLLSFSLLTLSQTTNFRHFQTERVCIQQFYVWLKWRKVLLKLRKHSVKEKLLNASNFSFSHGVFKTRACIRKG